VWILVQVMFNDYSTLLDLGDWSAADDAVIWQNKRWKKPDFHKITPQTSQSKIPRVFHSSNGLNWYNFFYIHVNSPFPDHLSPTRHQPQFRKHILKMSRPCENWLNRRSYSHNRNLTNKRGQRSLENEKRWKHWEQEKLLENYYFFRRNCCLLLSSFWTAFRHIKNTHF